MTLAVGPLAEYTYNISVPSEHAPGTFWIHPHVHGSSMRQVGGGAAAALIVRDPPGSLPAQVAAATDVMCVVQWFAVDELVAQAGKDGDEGWTASNGLDALGGARPTVFIARVSTLRL